MIMRIACQNNGRRGFTLVEILIAMAIFMVIITAIYASWSAILRSSQAGARAAAEVQRSRMAVKCVEDAISSTVYFNENSTLYSFEADTTTDFAYLSLVSRLPSSFPGSGLFPDQPIRRVAFEVIPGAAGNNELVMLQSSILQVLDAAEAPYTITLATNVSHFALEFWDDTLQDWAYEWLETNSVPRMMRVSMGFGGKNNSPYSSQQTVQAKTMYLAGTAITKEYQMPDATAGGTRGNKNNNNQVIIGPDGQPMVVPGGGQRRQNGQGGQGGQGGFGAGGFPGQGTQGGNRRQGGQQQNGQTRSGSQSQPRSPR
jgi:prepilin-type N-terminal cleavage/methylation domain-containing protein